jgi:hypothetical protein
VPNELVTGSLRGLLPSFFLRVWHKYTQAASCSRHLKCCFAHPILVVLKSSVPQTASCWRHVKLGRHGLSVIEAVELLGMLLWSNNSLSSDASASAYECDQQFTERGV